MQDVECTTYLFGSHGLLAGLVEFFNGLLVVTEILLAAHKNDGKARAEMENFGDPLQRCTRQQSLKYECPSRNRCQAYLLLNVVKGVRRVDGKADQDDMRVRV